MARFCSFAPSSLLLSKIVVCNEGSCEDEISLKIEKINVICLSQPSSNPIQFLKRVLWFCWTFHGSFRSLGRHLSRVVRMLFPSHWLSFPSPPQVVSLLRLKHNMKAEVCQLTSCDYIVSNRMAVKRKTASGKSGCSKIYPGLSLIVFLVKWNVLGRG